MAASTVTGATSIVLVSSIGTIVYLSSVVYPGHIVTIKDYTGVASQGRPIVVSTAKNVYFADKSISTLLYNPYSYLTVSSKTPTSWQIINTVGFLTSLSNAFVENLQAGSGFVSLVSSIEEYISSGSIGNISITNQFQLAGNAFISGNITVTDSVNLLSTLNVQDISYFSSALTVGGVVSLGSTLRVSTGLTVGGNVSTLQDLNINKNLYILGSLYASNAPIPRNLSVQTLTMNALTLASGLQTAGGITVGSNVFVAGSLLDLSSFQSLSSVQVVQDTFIQDDLSIQSLNTNRLQVYGSGSILKEASVSSITTGSLSTGGNLFVGTTLISREQTNVKDVLVMGSISANSVVVGGNVEISSMNLTGNLLVRGNASISESLTTSSLQGGITTATGTLTVGAQTSISSFFSTVGNLAVGKDFSVGSTLVVKGTTSINGSLTNVSSAEIYGTVSTNSLFVSTSLTILGDLSIPGTVKVETLAAPINFVLSTLNLSNTIEIQGNASIPYFESLRTILDYPNTILVGSTINKSYLNTYAVESTTNIQYELRDVSNNQIEISSIRSKAFYNSFQLKNFVIGSNSYLNPLVNANGFLLFSPVNTYKLSLSDLAVYTTNISFTGGAYGGYYTPSTQPSWILAGSDTNQKKTLQYTSNTTQWNSILTGGFPILGPPASEGRGRDVVYMSTTYQFMSSPKWIATGYGDTGGPSLQFSPDGSNWGPGAGSVFSNPYYGNRLLYYPSPINPNDGAIVLAGGYGGPSNFGIRYTYNGVIWEQAIAAYGSGEFICRDLTIGANSNIYAIGQNSFNQNNIFEATPSNFVTGWSNLSNLPIGPGTYNTLAYGNGFYVLGRSAISGNPLTSILKSVSLGSWTSITSGGFSVATNRIIYDSNSATFIAVGSNTGGSNVQYSVDGNNWFSVPYSFPQGISSIAPGVLPLPDTTSQFFIANVESRFQTAVSTAQLIASTITTSSLFANYYSGDGSQLVGDKSFSSRLTTSSILTTFTNALSTVQYMGTTLTGTMGVQSYLNCDRRPFFSTVNINIATGLDFNPLANTQITGSVSNWTQTSNPTFEYYGTGLAQNGSLVAPLFIATGADSRTNHTIKYSVDGYTWNPVVTGGFSLADSNGVKVGNTANYFSYTVLTTTYKRWLVGGNALVGEATIFQSTDGSNFTPVPTPPPNPITKIKSDSYALALDSNGYTYSSSNGLNWIATAQPSPITAFGFGYTNTTFGLYGYDANSALYRYIESSELWITLQGFTGIFSTRDMAYNSNAAGGYWLIIANSGNSLFKSSDLTSYIDVTSAFTSGVIFKSLFWDSNRSLWYVGTNSQEAVDTLWYSDTGIGWNRIQSGGFSTGVVSYGAGYSILYASSIFLTGGTGANSILTNTRPQILQVKGIVAPTFFTYTSTLLTTENASNVFNSNVYGLAFADTPSQTYPWIAVGDGITPQKTIARTSNLYDWIPATTGGFSPAGYGAIHYSIPNVFLAVGDAAASTATIQYSPDGANWFATNNSGALPLGGRAIAKFPTNASNYPNRLVAVGLAPYESDVNIPRKTMAYSDDGFNWSNIASNTGFQYGAYGIGVGTSSYPNQGMVAVGEPYDTDPTTVNPLASIKYSSDGITWSNATSGGFNIRGRGVTFGNSESPYFFVWVAVGEDTDPKKRIQYSVNGKAWGSLSLIIEAEAYYSVAFQDTGFLTGYFVAVGKNKNAQKTVVWTNNIPLWNFLYDQNSGFISKQQFGSANAITGATIQYAESGPFLQFPSLNIYERTTALNYAVPSIRVQSTLMTFNEALSVNLSSQVMMNTYTPFGSNTATVQGDVRTSSFYYTGTEPFYRNINVSSFIASTLQFNTSLLGNQLTTPSLGIGVSTVSKANTMYTIKPAGSALVKTNINDTVYVNQFIKAGSANNFRVGININKNTDTTYELDVSGLIGCSSLTSAVYTQNQVYLNTVNQEYIQSPNLSILEGSNTIQNQGKNTIYSQVSSISFNSILTLNTSTQKVGIFTSNPLFGVDCRSAGYLSTLTTNTVNTKTLFFTLQSV